MTDGSRTVDEQIVRDFLYGGDPELFAADGKLINLLPDELPYGGTYVGPAGVRRYVEELRSALRIESLEIDDVITSGDRVVVVGREQSRFHGNGQAYRMDWVHVNRLRDGKITEMREYNDTAAMLQAFRSPPAP